MATHSSILAWKIPWTEEPVELQSRGSQSQTQLSNSMHILDLRFKKMDAEAKMLKFYRITFQKKSS